MKTFVKVLFLVMTAALISCADTTSVQKSNEDTETAAGGNSSIEEIEKEKTPIEDSETNTSQAESAEKNSDQNSPENLIERLYKRHDNESSPFFQDKNRGLVNEFFVKSLADLIWKDAVESKGEAGALNFDPLYNAQDTEISNFAVGNPEIRGEKASVPVTFENFGEKQTIKYLLAKENNVWKIEDIDYGEFTLTKTFEENSK